MFVTLRYTVRHSSSLACRLISFVPDALSQHSVSRQAPSRQPAVLHLLLANVLDVRSPDIYTSSRSGSSRNSERSCTSKQPIFATVDVFFSRFYFKDSYYETDPFVIIAACCYATRVCSLCRRVDKEQGKVIQWTTSLFMPSLRNPSLLISTFLFRLQHIINTPPLP